MAIPNVADLTLFLQTTGVTPNGTEDLSAVLDAAILEFEQLTGRVDYEASTVETDTRYTIEDPSGRYVQLILPVNYYSISDVQVGYNGEAGSGQSLELYKDYTLYPSSAGEGRMPIEAIRFLTKYTLEPGSILVTGKKGCYLTFPADAKRAILSKAAALCLIDAAGPVGDAVEQKQGDRSVKFGVADGSSTVDRLQGYFTTIANKYKRVII